MSWLNFCPDLSVFAHQVFNTYSNEDYDRRNEEVDPVASSAEYELEKRVEKLEIFPVELEKGGKGGINSGVVFSSYDDVITVCHT